MTDTVFIPVIDINEVRAAVNPIAGVNTIIMILNRAIEEASATGLTRLLLTDAVYAPHMLAPMLTYKYKLKSFAKGQVGRDTQLGQALGEFRRNGYNITPVGFVDSTYTIQTKLQTDEYLQLEFCPNLFISW